MLLNIRDRGGQIKPTHLMYKSNLAHSQMQQYLAELLEKSLIDKNNNKNGTKITITDKGLNFIRKMQEMKEFERTFGF